MSSVPQSQRTFTRRAQLLMRLAYDVNRWRASLPLDAIWRRRAAMLVSRVVRLLMGGAS